MHIQVNGKQIDVGDALTERVETEMQTAVDKYFDRSVDSIVTFSRDGRGFQCDTNVHLPTGLTAQSSATDHDIHIAFDKALTRVEKQLRRYKRRLRDHNRTRKSPVDAAPAPAYVLAAPQIEQEADEPETLQPVIVAETTQDIQALSVGEAVMQMELAGREFLMFRHDGNDRINLVFRRDDGNIGWIDPSNPGGAA